MNADRLIMEQQVNANEYGLELPISAPATRAGVNADERGLDLDKVTEKIIGCAYAVSNVLGAGFLEKVYENALSHELRKAGCSVVQQQPILVKYDGVVVGDFAADIVVEGCVIVELKTARAFDEIHMAQCLNYLKATDLKVCLLLNFGKPKVEIKRVVHNY